VQHSAAHFAETRANTERQMESSRPTKDAILLQVAASVQSTVVVIVREE